MWRFERGTLQISEGQTHCGMPKGAKISLALNEPEIGCYYQIQNYLQVCTTRGKKFLV